MEKKKKPELDNELIKLPLKILGLFIGASMIMLLFSYQVPADAYRVDRDNRDKGEIPEEIVVVEQPEEEPVVQVLPPPDIQPPPSPDIETKDNTDDDEPVIIATPPIDLKIEPEPEPATIPVDYPDKEAEFPGGMAAMKKYLADNIEYPEFSLQVGDQGKVFIEFIVEKDGSISQIKTLKGVSKEIDQEAKRVVKSMPSWKPAEVQGESVRARCRVPINFILQP